MHGSRTGRIAFTALTAAAALLVAACQSGTPAATQLNPTAVASKPAAAVAKYLEISPAPSAKDVNPASGITVTAVNGGKITNVTVKTTSAEPVSGALSAAKTSWHSTYALPTDASYTVTATGTDGSGHPVTATSRFRTPNPSDTFAAEIYEGTGDTYGVGMPIMLTFSSPIKNKAAVERSLQITTSKPVIGAWYWDGSEQLDFRPRDYWPAGTTVSFDGHLDGVEGAPGMYGDHDLTQSFNIGQSLIAVANTSTHRTQIYVDGKLAYNWPISTGRATMPTPDGTYLTVQKNNPVRMIGGTKGTAGYYNELVNWAVRFTFSGDWDDGWTEWFLSWQQYLAGSATHLAVQAGPDGSTFVSPSSLPADTGNTPLGTSSPGNYYAA